MPFKFQFFHSTRGFNSGAKWRNYDLIKLWNACHLLFQKPQSSHFIPNNILIEHFGCFLYGFETWFLLLREKHKYFRRRRIGQCLESGEAQLGELQGCRAAGRQGCIPHRDIENIKTNIWINIFNRSLKENIYSHT